MNSYIVIVIVIVVALVVAYAIMRKRKSGDNVRPDENQNTESQSGSSFHAVSLKYAANACQAAVDMDGRRFLSGAAPRIPLPGCDAHECRCKFLHHEDRRANEDRRNPYGQGTGIGAAGQLLQEQRDSSERREDPPDDIL